MYFAPVAAPSSFVVRELNPDVRARTDVQRLLDGLDQPVAFIPNMRCVERRAGFASCDCAARELIQIGITSRFVDQAARDTNRSLFDCFAHETCLRTKLIAFQATICRAGYARARRSESNERCNVECDARALDFPKEPIERGPLDLNLQTFGLSELTFTCISVQRCNGRTAITADLRRN